MRAFLIGLFVVVLVTMLYVTISASLDQSIVTAGAALWPDAWFRATLADAYFGFLTFFAWVAYKQRTTASRVLWFVLIMLLGNIAMSIYVLRELIRTKPDEPLFTLLTRRYG